MADKQCDASYPCPSGYECVAGSDGASACEATSGWPPATGLAITSVRSAEPQVGKRMWVTGDGFQDPYTANIVTVDDVPAYILATESSQHELVFLVPDVPGVPKTATLEITALEQSVTHEFPLLAAEVVPEGSITVVYRDAPTAFGSGPNLVAGDYTFGMNLTITVSANSVLRLTPEIVADGWTATLVDASGTMISNLVNIPEGTNIQHYVRVRVHVPNDGPDLAELNLRAHEETPGTKVTPGSRTVSLDRDAPVPRPEERVVIALASPTGTVVENGRLLLPSDDRKTLKFGVTLAVHEQHTVDCEILDPNGWESLVLTPTLNPTGPGTTTFVDVRLKGIDPASLTELRLEIACDTVTPAIRVVYLLPIGVQ